MHKRKFNQLRLNKLTLKNYGRHRDRVIEFHTGLNAITGANGCGKSTIFIAIYWLLTGENIAAGVKLDNVCDKAPPTEVSYGSLEFEHNGNTYVVQRHLRPETKKATLESAALDKKVLGDKAVTEKILQILDVDPKVLRACSIVQQGELLSFMATETAERAKMFQRLFGTERCAEIAKALAKHRDTIKLPSLVDVDEKRRDVDNATAAFNQASAALEQHTPQPLLLQQRDQINTRLSQETTKQKLLSEQQQQLLLIRQLEQDHVRLTSQVEVAKQNVATIEALLAELSAKATLAKEHLRQHEQHETVLRTQASLQARLVSIAESLRQAKQPAEPLPADLEQQLQDISHTSGAATFELTAIAARHAKLGDKSECPTCGAVVNVDNRQKDRDRSTFLQKLLDDNLAKYNHISQLSDGWKAYNSNIQRLTNEQNTTQAQLGALQLSAPPTTTREDCQKAVVEHQQTVMTATQHQVSKQRLETDLTGCARQLAVYRDQYNRSTEQLATLPTDQIDVVAWQNAVADVDRQLQQLTVLQSHVSIATSTLQWAQQSLAQAEQAQRENDRTRRWLTFLAKLEEMYHYNGLPKVVSQSCLVRLEQSVNAFLSILSADFRVTPTTDLSFDASFADGSSRPARRLSFGQLVTLGIAFMLSVNFQFLGQLGILLIDEPTAWLDKERVEALLPTLTRLRDAATARSLQLIIVTHEESLKPAFNHVISLPPITNA